MSQMLETKGHNLGMDMDYRSLPGEVKAQARILGAEGKEGCLKKTRSISCQPLEGVLTNEGEASSFFVNRDLLRIFE